MGTYQEGTYHCDSSQGSFELQDSEPLQDWEKPAPKSTRRKVNIKISHTSVSLIQNHQFLSLRHVHIYNVGDAIGMRN